MVCAQRYLFSLKSQLAPQHSRCGGQVPVGAALNTGCLLPGQCSGEGASTVCGTGDGYRAGGKGWQVPERRELL